ncbi:MAG: S41 family peptidase [Chloroflexi bacterium]|nr:S41 family peptidase [Chloroflexota bacterium]
MSSSNNTFRLIAILLIALLLGSILCLSGFGLGFATGRWSAQPRAEASPVLHHLAPTDTPPLSEAPSSSVQTIEAPENFEIFWEVMDHLEGSFDGEVPQGEAITAAAIAGVKKAAGDCSQPSSTIIQINPPKIPRHAPKNFDEFWSTVNELYRQCGADMPAPEELVYAAANGVIDELDDHYTTLLTPAQAEEFRISINSSFEGIGATVQPTDEEKGTGVEIVYTFPNSPAEKSGLRPHDQIIAVDGQDVTQMNLNDAVLLIRGPAGSQVVLSILRDEQPPFDVTVTRDRIDIPILRSEIRDDNLLYIQLSDFSPRATEEMRKALQNGLDAQVKGIILDLRGNPGGRLDASIDIASFFIKQGVIVSESGHRNIKHEATGDVIVPDLPLAVLVDGGSASASEIVAGAIQDHQRGVLVGEQTFGKGSVQTLFTLSDGSMLRVTTARWYTPSGRQIDGAGLTPDIIVPFENAGSDTEDPQLQAAVDYLLKKIQ